MSYSYLPPLHYVEVVEAVERTDDGVWEEWDRLTRLSSSGSVSSSDNWASTVPMSLTPLEINVPNVASVSHLDFKAIEWFVTGAVLEYFEYMNIPSSDERFQNYKNSAIETVIGYLRGSKTLDGSVSDLVCCVAIEAKKVFLKT